MRVDMRTKSTMLLRGLFEDLSVVETSLQVVQKCPEAELAAVARNMDPDAETSEAPVATAIDPPVTPAASPAKILMLPPGPEEAESPVETRTLPLLAPAAVPDPTMIDPVAPSDDAPELK